jgi:hypothetical protein
MEIIPVIIPRVSIVMEIVPVIIAGVSTITKTIPVIIGIVSMITKTVPIIIPGVSMIIRIIPTITKTIPVITKTPVVVTRMVLGVTKIAFQVGNLAGLTLGIERRPNPARIVIARRRRLRYIGGMNWLTKQEQLVLGVIVGMLLTGWAVKTYRAAHPPTPVVVQPARP